MIVTPEEIVFESSNDIVDYVSRGMIPSRKNFEKVMFKVRCPDENQVEPNQVYVPENLFMNFDSETMEKTLRRVYENRVYNRNVTIGMTIGLVVMGLIFGGISNSKKKHSKEDSYDELD